MFLLMIFTLNNCFVFIQSGITTPADRDKEELIKQTFQSTILSALFPRTKISIIIQEINNDGSLLATIINATTLALMDAGIPIKSLIAASSTVIQEDDIQITKKNIDVCLENEQNARASFLFAFNSSVDGIVTCQSLGSFSEDEYWKVLALSKDATKQIFSAMRKCIEFKEQKE